MWLSRDISGAGCQNDLAGGIRSIFAQWPKNCVLHRVFEKLPIEQIVRIRIEAFSLDSTSVKVHPDGTGALKKTGPSVVACTTADLQSDGKCNVIDVPAIVTSTLVGACLTIP